MESKEAHQPEPNWDLIEKLDEQKIRVPNRVTLHDAQTSRIYDSVLGEHTRSKVTETVTFPNETEKELSFYQAAIDLTITRRNDNSSASPPTKSEQEVHTTLCTTEGQRDGNEDILAVEKILLPNNQEIVFAALADGAGGQEKGEVVSHESVKLALEYLASLEPKDWQKIEDTAQNLYTTPEDILAKLMFKHVSQNLSGEDNRMTTFTTCLIFPYGTQVVHLGDSRLYAKDTQGARLITTDHTATTLALAENKIKPQDVPFYDSRFGHAIYRSLRPNKQTTPPPLKLPFPNLLLY